MKTRIKELMREMGFRERLPGTQQLKAAIAMYAPGMCITKVLYPTLARNLGTTAGAVERNMRYAIEDAWLHGDATAQERIFGASVWPTKGRPTVADFVAQMWYEVGDDAN